MCVHRADDGKCRLFSNADTVSWCVDGPCEHEVMSNGDKIRAMSDEDLAAFMASLCHSVRVSTFKQIQSVVVVDAPVLATHDHFRWLKEPWENQTTKE